MYLSNKKIIVIFLCVYFGGHAIFSGESYDDSLETKIYEIADSLRCPTCQGLSVAASQTEISANMKSKIRELLKEGKSEAEIYQFFENRYGEWIFREPSKKGSNLIVWFLPGVMVAGSLFIFGFYILKKTRRTRSMEIEKTSLDHLPESTENKDLDDKLAHLRKVL